MWEVRDDPAFHRAVVSDPAFLGDDVTAGQLLGRVDPGSPDPA